ncbi:type II toxin-antitoxin system HicB family antitoxin [bacterium]|nr:type II toxin-antitoxin system HicB family antitoxin [bacterium]
MIKELTLEYWRDGKWFVGRIVEIPGLYSQGESLDELQSNLYDAYYLMTEDGIPPKGTDVVRIAFEIEE